MEWPGSVKRVRGENHPRLPVGDLQAGRFDRVEAANDSACTPASTNPSTNDAQPGYGTVERRHVRPGDEAPTEVRAIRGELPLLV